MARRSLQEQFLHTLAEMALKTPDGRVSSAALKAQLNWTVPDRFRDKRAELLKAGAIQAFPGGQGGSLAAARKPTPAPAPLKAFLSYCHADAGLKEELLNHLKPLERLKLVEAWHDGDINVGQDWEKVISSNLKGADIIVLLVTIDFINSEYCYEKEFMAAVDRHKAKKTRLIPVIGRSCLWEDLPFGEIQAALGGKPITSYPNRDEALTQVTKEIKRAAEEIRKERAKAA